jgi:hypothetical protein
LCGGLDGVSRNVNKEKHLGGFPGAYSASRGLPGIKIDIKQYQSLATMPRLAHPVLIVGATFWEEGFECLN